MKFKYLLAVPLLLAPCGCSTPNPSHSGDSAKAPVDVRYREIRLTSEPQTLTLTGTVKSRRQTVLSSRLSGFIQFLRVEEGDPVGADEVLVRIDTADIQAQAQQAAAGQAVAQAAQQVAQASIAGAQSQVDQARAGLQAAQRQLDEAKARQSQAAIEEKRQTFLAGEGAVPRQRAEQAHTDYQVSLAQVQTAQAMVDQSKAAISTASNRVQSAQAGLAQSAAGVNQARSGVAASRVPLEYGELRAPFAGVVVKKMAFQGEVASPGKPILEIQDNQNLELALDVPESQREAIYPNQKLPVQIPALKKTVSAHVRQVIANTDPASRTFVVRLQLEHASYLLPGMYGRVDLPQPPQSKLWIPANSLVSRGGLDGVFLVGENAEFRLVKVGAAQKERVEILSGLTPNEKVVIDPPAALVEGAPIRASLESK
jgi:multidrug efflux pump subunit AcrA (membrane-fusion protein)